MMKEKTNFLKKPFAATVIAIICGFIVAAVVLAIAGCNPLQAFSIMFKGIFSKPKYIANVIIKATPIILTGVSIAFAFKVGLFNIGAEGQFVAGTVVATMVGILTDLPAIIEYPLILFSGMAAGALWGGVVGWLKAKYGIHEVITSIMFNWIAFYFCNFVVSTKTFHQPDSTSTYNISQGGIDFIYNWKKSEAGKAVVTASDFLRETVGKTSMNIGFLFAIAVAVLIFILLNKTSKGYELRAVGLNADAAEFAGISVKKNVLHAMLIAGAISGFAGALHVSGVAMKVSTLGAFENFGFNGMSVALIAGSSPIGCIFAGLLFAGLLYGGGSIQSEIGAPSEVINIMIGTIVFFVALAGMVRVIAEKLEKGGKKNA